jgi:hypothetical protein
VSPLLANVYLHYVFDLSAPRGAVLHPPLSGEGTEGESLGLMAYPVSKENPGKIACQRTSGRAQAYGARRWGTRVTWRKLHCLNPNLQKVRLHTRRKDA